MDKPLTHNDIHHLELLWDEALKVVKNELNATAFSLWFPALQPATLQEGVLTIETPDSFSARWVQNHYGDMVTAVLKTLSPDVRQVSFTPRPRRAKSPDPVVPARPEEKPRPARDTCGNNLNPTYTFDHFVVGDCNRLAHAAALSVCQSPGTAYNPLFIYGAVGVGKTHLMQAIGLALQDNANLSVAYLSSEQFLNAFISSLQNKNTVSFRNRFREADLLLIDDIHFIGGKEETQREFFHTFNVLYDGHKQIILSSDRPPKEMKNIERRLVSRFELGLVVDINPPDLETRVAILQHKAQKRGFSLTSDILFYLAENLEGNVRVLEGALNKLIACAQLYEKEVVDLPFTREILKKTIRAEGEPPVKVITVEAIQQWIGDYYQIKLVEIKGKKRNPVYVLPRQIAIYLSRKMTGLSLPQLGECFGGKNHTTMLYACKKIEDKIGKNVGFKEELSRMMVKIKQDINT